LDDILHKNFWGDCFSELKKNQLKVVSHELEENLSSIEILAYQ